MSKFPVFTFDAGTRRRRRTAGGLLTMTNYNIRALVDRTKGTRILLDPPHPSWSSEIAYLRALRAMLRGMLAYVGDNILPAYARTALRLDAGLTVDVEEGEWSGFEEATARLVAVAETTVSTIIALEAVRYDKEFMSIAKKALGIDLTAVVREEDLGGYLDLASQRNANLIKGLADDTYKKIKDRTLSAVMSGTPAKEYRAQLAKEFGLSDNRAKLIARDQIGKLNSDLTKIRQQQAGIDRYVWRTAQDERVRQLHQALQGNEYAYGKATGAEGGLPPGQPIQCRCYAQGVIVF